jgi:Synergist-CTERM protein sorting domain-containing protein
VPVAPDNTRVIIDFDSDGKIIGVSITTNGQPIPSNVLFYVWLILDPAKSGGASVNDVSAGGYYGPFVVQSAAGSFNIDVNNLKKPDGTKAFIPTGSYIVKFADKSSVDAGTDPKYVGTSETSVSLKATGDDSSSSDGGSNRTSGSGGGGGGCDAGFAGIFALLAATMIIRKKR